jgi:hypothetical protein
VQIDFILFSVCKTMEILLLNFIKPVEQVFLHFTKSMILVDVCYWKHVEIFIFYLFIYFLYVHTREGWRFKLVTSTSLDI